MTPYERGAMGYIATEAKYGKAQMDRWRRSGGRKPNPTLADLEARDRGATPTKARERRAATPGGSR